MEQPVADLADVPLVRLPLALARLHGALKPGTAVELPVPAHDPDLLAAVLAGGGFEAIHLEDGGGAILASATRARTLPDTVRPGMRLLVCGLNPSLYSADRGVGYARPGNRFWPAALAARIVLRDRDAHHAVATCGIGMTDMVKRATVGAAELTADEYRSGAARVGRLVRWLQPSAVCFVGLAGWRATVDPRAVAGPQREPFGGRPAYVMPSTSGLNARSSLAELTDHLAAAVRLASAGTATIH